MTDDSEATRTSPEGHFLSPEEFCSHENRQAVVLEREVWPGEEIFIVCLDCGIKEMCT